MILKEYDLKGSLVDRAVNKKLTRKESLLIDYFEDENLNPGNSKQLFEEIKSKFERSRTCTDDIHLF